jgi:hypothetical protein
LAAQSLDPKDENVQKTVAVYAQHFGELVADNRCEGCHTNFERKATE